MIPRENSRMHKSINFFLNCFTVLLNCAFKECQSYNKFAKNTNKSFCFLRLSFYNSNYNNLIKLKFHHNFVKENLFMLLTYQSRSGNMNMSFQFKKEFSMSVKFFLSIIDILKLKRKICTHLKEQRKCYPLVVLRMFYR